MAPKKKKKRHGRKKHSSDYWIQGATKPKNKGKYRASVKRRYGRKGFTKDGDIKMSVINKDIHSKNPTLRHRAQFAKNV